MPSKPAPAPSQKQAGEKDAPWVLGINTASETLGIALAHGHDLQAELFVVPSGARGHHAERLMVGVESLCRLCDRTPSDLAAVAVAVGPGGFTGVRTALSAAKAIAQSLDKPLIGVTTLEALAEQAPVQGLVSPLVDARRGDVFAALYRRVETGLQVVLPPELTPLSTWLDKLASTGHTEVAFVGDGAAHHPEAIAGRYPCGVFEPSMHLLRAGSVARLGARRLASGDYGDPREVMPEYLRSPSAVPNWQPLYVPPTTEDRP